MFHVFIFIINDHLFVSVSLNLVTFVFNLKVMFRTGFILLWMRNKLTYL